MNYNTLKDNLISDILTKEYNKEWEELNLNLFDKIITDITNEVQNENNHSNIDLKNYTLEVISTLDYIGKATMFPNTVESLTRLLIKTSLRFLKDNYYFDVDYKHLKNKMYKVYKKKNKDYENSSEKQLMLDGVKSFKMRLQDKISRVYSYYTKESYEVEDESLVDTVLDLIGYSVIFLVWYEKRFNTSN